MGGIGALRPCGADGPVRRRERPVFWLVVKRNTREQAGAEGGSVNNCIECLHWMRWGSDYIVRHIEQEQPWGECAKAITDESLMKACDEGLTGIETHQTFGCVQFTQKEHS